jgi:hypothetical protein
MNPVLLAAAASAKQRKALREQQEAALPEGATSRRSVMGGDPIKRTPELERILALPRRAWDDQEGKFIAAEMSETIRRPNGTQTLRPVQALALHDLASSGKGLFCTARVGAGKTLISLLSPYVADSKRPLLLIPAKLMNKTQRDAAILRLHWPIPRVMVETYEKLSRVQSAELLDSYRPDLIIADESHRLKNPKAACTRRVKRFMDEHPETKFVALSGTITKRSIGDYAHVLKWTHGDDRPIPRSPTEVETWQCALDEKVSPLARRPCGALALLCNDEELAALSEEPLSSVRRAFQRRLVDTTGVISTKETFLGASIQITRLDIPPVPEILNCFDMLRNDWTRPDGVDLADPAEVYRHARELALGFYYRWCPAAPNEWMEVRRQWNKLVRAVLSRSRTLDSELQVVNAIDNGVIDGQETLAAWREIKPTFVPVTECVWVSHVAINMAAKWMTENRGIVWTEHVEFANKLEEVSGIPYYGRQGKSRGGKIIEDHPPGRPMIASIKSNSEGRNLQAWSTNLITSIMPNGAQYEQLMGRCHREGQEADEVSFDCFIGCWEHIKHFDQAMLDAKYAQDSLGQVQKLLYGDIDMPTLEEWRQQQATMGELPRDERLALQADFRMMPNDFRELAKRDAQ